MLTKLNLRILCSFADTLNCYTILGEIDTNHLERIDYVFDHDDVRVLATEVSISIFHRLDLENTCLHLQDGNVECTATEIVDSDDGVVCAVKTENQGGSSRFIDHSADLEASNLTSILIHLLLGPLLKYAGAMMTA
jgi:hypothetical protein